ncbi:hypothetical protein P171DRAFT_426516 [Karstenula rhodostoma CBS 690.94]|uniref:Uncharacterized protein n=1 Tax=Karstenula rhodostoma CBS 690.94 TaxID=1392251 RepID=A0A9P4Q081_9PLEO|nr:hypothetical protein P171DRAFT_426516 [Karstenula rhodostoma CBS 690.94]
MARRVMVQCGAHKAHWIFMQQLLLDGRIWGEGVQRWMGDETDKLRFKVTTVTEKLWHRNKTVTEKTRNTLSLPQGRSTLPELLYFFRTWLNGDPRDTVYSLLALVESQELGIIVDYTRSDVDVLVDVVDCTLRHDNDLNLIGLPWAPNIVGLPSWIVPTDSHSRYRDEFDFITSAIHVSPPTNINLPTSPWRTNASIVRRREISPVPFVFPNYTLFVDGLTLGTYDETAKLPDNDLSFYEYKRLLPYSVRQFYLWTTATLDRPEAHSATSKPGDRLVVLFGCNHILTLRPVESHFVLVESWLGNFWDFLTSDQHRLHADAMAYRNKIKNFLKDLPTETFAIA